VRVVMMSVIVLVVMMLTGLMLVRADALYPAGGGVAHRGLGAFGTAAGSTH
jgi:hypothetical protein